MFQNRFFCKRSKKEKAFVDFSKSLKFAIEENRNPKMSELFKSVVDLFIKLVFKRKNTA